MGAFAVDRLVVPTCVGCGAMAIYGTCQGGCTEERLDLVGADALDELEADLVRSRAATDSFWAIAQDLARGGEPAGGWEPAYRRLQAQACEALRVHPEPAAALEEPAREVTTWSCPKCGGLDAPQPCLGICVWRPVEWVRREAWQAQEESRRIERGTEALLRGLLRRLAFTTPRENHWQAGWEALNSAARQVLAVVQRPPGGHRA